MINFVHMIAELCIDRSQQGFSRLLARGSPTKSPVKVAGSSRTGAVKGALNFDDHGELSYFVKIMPPIINM
jgi:hypothetical protein